MTLYLILITLSAGLIILFNWLFSSSIFGFDFGYIVWASLLSIVIIIAIDGFLAFLAHRLPPKMVNPFLKYYVVSKKERKFYEKIGVKQFKDFLPDLGSLFCDFAKKKIKEPANKEYLLKYMQESCYGEVGHNLSVVLGFSVIFVFPLRYWLCFGFPVSVINAILNLLPTIALRYNRSKLAIAYKRLDRLENQEKKI